MIKLKNSNFDKTSNSYCDETKKSNCDETQISNCDETQEDQIVMKLKNLNGDNPQKLKL